MKYIALIYSDHSNPPAPSTEGFGKMMAGYETCNTTYRNDGVYIAGDALQPTTTATTVRVRDGRVETMDGPFAETKEQLGGFYLIDVPDLDAAMRYAAEIPAARYGTVEIRPIMDTAPLLPGG